MICGDCAWLRPVFSKRTCEGGLPLIVGYTCTVTGKRMGRHTDAEGCPHYREQLTFDFANGKEAP